MTKKKSFIDGTKSPIKKPVLKKGATKKGGTNCKHNYIQHFIREYAGIRYTEDVCSMCGHVKKS